MKNTSSTLRPLKDDLGLKTWGVLHSMWMWKSVCGPNWQTFKIRCQEHVRHLHHGQTEKSAVAEHLLNAGHEIQFEKTHRLNRANIFMDRIVQEAIEIELHAENFSREAGFILSCTWQLVISLLKCSPQPAINSPGQVQQLFDSSH
jgi:hypothetical protein